VFPTLFVAFQQDHQKWIVDTLKEDGGSCTYERLVEVGEEKHCDTVGAMLKILKNRKVIGYEQIFLMYPMHKVSLRFNISFLFRKKTVF
jgi:hypothetical protein